MALFLSACTYNESFNTSPTIEVVRTQEVTGGDEVSLTVTATDEDGAIADYLWSQLTGTVVTLSNSDESTATFTAPVSGELQTLTFQISVMDNEGAFTRAMVTVIVAPGLATPESLTAVTTGTSLILDWETIEAAEGYRVYRATESFTSISDLAYYSVLDNATLIDGLEHSTYTFTGLTTGTTYYFVVSSTHTNGEESAASDEVVRTIGQEFEVNAPLNDTTVRRCMAGGNAMGNCPVTGLEGQDGDYGRTAENEDNLLAKTGSGPAGFDFTPLDEDGTVLTTVDDAACVRDNHTGLIWELKLSEYASQDDLRYIDNQYTWFSGDDDTNGGVQGTFLGSECGGGYCNTQSYYSELNRLKFCGVTTWRLPTVTQLRGITDIASLCEELDYSSGCWFAWGEYVWSANSFALDPEQAWRVSLGFENDLTLDKGELSRVVMVADVATTTTTTTTTSTSTTTSTTGTTE